MSFAAGSGRHQQDTREQEAAHHERPTRTPCQPLAGTDRLCAGALMIVLDSTVFNVALPSIQHDLGFTSASLVNRRRRPPLRLSLPP